MSGMMTGQAVPSKTSARDDEERRMMQMMEQIQQRRAPNAKVAMTPQAQQQMQNFEAARAQAMQPARSVSGGSTTAKPEQAGLLSRLGRGALDALQDPVRQAQIVTALNSMRLQPDPNLAKSMQARAAGVQQRRTNQEEVDAALNMLQQRGLLSNYSEEQIQQLRRSPRVVMAMVSEAMKAPAAPSVFQQKINALISTGVPRADAIRQVIEGEVAGTTLNMPDPAKSAIFKETYATDVALRKGATAALETINKSNETLSLLSQGNLNLGIANPALQFKDRILTMLGSVEAAERASDTQLLNSMLGTDVFGAISALGIGARGLDTPAEREFLREVLTGTTSMDAPAIEKMARLRAKYAKRALTRYNSAVEKGQFDYIEEALNAPKGSRFGTIKAPEIINISPAERPVDYPIEDWNLIPPAEKEEARRQWLSRG